MERFLLHCVGLKAPAGHYSFMKQIWELFRVSLGDFIKSPYSINLRNSSFGGFLAEEMEKWVREFEGTLPSAAASSGRPGRVIGPTSDPRIEAPCPRFQWNAE